MELTEGILLSCTNAIETSAWFMINSTALGPVRLKFKDTFQLDDKMNAKDTHDKLLSFFLWFEQIKANTLRMI